ncbi:MAG: NAD(P)-dependent alcohol dehydrogenase [Methanobacteriota archaeon]|nr:MAG: NAD(P)-dependent alcohol dehydrogenase [Euryarchaeota archaeon]
MKAMTFTSPGPPPVFRSVEIEKPVPKDDEVLVKVYATSVNSWDWELTRKKPSGVYLGKRANPKYRIMGADVAGVVEGVGKDITRFKLGDEVFGDLCKSGWGGYAEYVCATEEALTPKPSFMTFEEAAATPQAGLLALQGLHKFGRIKPDRRILINGAGGGVGSFAIQIAKLYGAEVTGVDSAEKSDFMRSLGADYVIDYKKEDFTDSRQQYDLIIDMKGDRSISAYKRSLRPKGRCFLVGGKMSVMLKAAFFGSFGSKKVKLFLYKPNENLDILTDFIKIGKVKPMIDRLYPLTDIAAAIRYLGEGRVKGKVVISLALKA